MQTKKLDSEILRIAAVLGWGKSRADELVRRYLVSMEEPGMGRGNDLYVRAIVLDMTKFRTKKEAKAAAERFNADVTKAQRDGETDVVYRTTASGRSVRVEYSDGDGEWHMPG